MIRLRCVCYARYSTDKQNIERARRRLHRSK